MLAVLLYVWLPAVFSAVPSDRISWVERHYTVQNGLSVNALSQVLQDESGFVWISSFDGLMRFDGARFDYFDSRTYPEIPSNRIISVVTNGAGHVFAHTERGQAFRIYRDSVEVFFLNEPGPEVDVRHVTPGADGSVLIATTTGIYRWTEQTGLKPYAMMSARRVAEDAWGRLFLQGPDRVIRVRELDGSLDSLAFLQSPLRLLPRIIHTDSAVFQAFGPLVIESRAEGYRIHRPLPDPGFEVYGMVRLASGTFLLKTQGLGRFEWTPGAEAVRVSGPVEVMAQDLVMPDGKVLEVNRHSLLLDGRQAWDKKEIVQHAMLDRNGNLWIATADRGLFRLSKNRVRAMGRAEGLPYENVYSITRTPDGRIWMPMQEGPLGILDQGRLRIIQLPVEVRYQAGRIVSSAYPLRSGRVLLGTITGGLVETDGRESRWIPLQHPGQEVQGIYEFPDGTLWLGTSDGILASVRPGLRNGFKLVEKGPRTQVRVFRQLSDGTLLLGGTRSGIWRYKDGDFMRLERDFTFHGAIRDIYEDTLAAGTGGRRLLFVGTEAQGLVITALDESGKPFFRQLTSKDNLIDDTIHRIFRDRLNRFWIGTNKGVMVISAEGLYAYLDGRTPVLPVTVLDEDNGMRNREVNSGGQTAGLQNANGELWFPTQAGYAIFDPELDWGLNGAFPVTFLSVQTRDRRVPAGKTVELTSRERSFRVNWSAPDFSKSKGGAYRIRLAGYSNEWIRVNNKSEFDFVNVPGGTYRFEVQHAGAGGAPAPEVAVLIIQIRKTFFETAWFYMLLLGLAGGAGFLIVRGLQKRARTARERLQRTVSERTRELEAERNITQQQADRLRKLDAARSRFLSSISHEMRTPLTLVVGPVKLMLEQKDRIDPDLLSQLMLIDQSADRLAALLDNLLDLTRFESGDVALEKADFQLQDLLLQAVQRSQALFSAHHTALHYEPAHEPLMVSGDARRIAHVFDHVLALIGRFAQEGSVVTIRMVHADSIARLIFHDSGPGIPDAELNRVFDIFFQIRDASGAGVLDSGVGLAFSRQIIQLHNGNMDVRRREDGTKEISITLPVEAGAEGAVALPGPDEMLPEPAPISDETSRKILVVDDNLQIRRFVRLIFEGKYRIVEAENGLQALEVAQLENPDLIIADVMMPELDGVSMVRRLRDDMMLAGTPVVMLTARDSVEETVEGLEAGADVYLTKPFNADVLKSQVAALLKTREKLRAVQSRTSRPDEAPGPVHPFAARVQDIIAASYQDPEFGVETIAERLYMDRTQLFRKLKQAGDLTASRMILEYRMAKAREMMLARAGNISEVAYACGFNSLSHFGQTFKSHFGLSPREWMEKQFPDRSPAS